MGGTVTAAMFAGRKCTGLEKQRDQRHEDRSEDPIKIGGGMHRWFLQICANKIYLKLTRRAALFCVVYAVEKRYPMVGKPVRPCAVPEQGEVAMRGISVAFLSLRHICDRVQAVCADIRGC